MKVRIVDKISARLAYLNAVQQQSYMVRHGAPPAGRQAMPDPFETDRMTVLTIIDAILHLPICFQ